MTEQLKQAAQQALDALKKKHGHWGQGHDQLNAEAISALERVLTTSQPAQAGEVDELPGMWDHSDLSGGETDAKPEWRDLFWALARELKCLPSTDPGANQHVFRAARAFASLPTQPAPQATQTDLDRRYSDGWNDCLNRYVNRPAAMALAHKEMFGEQQATPEPVEIVAAGWLEAPYGEFRRNPQFRVSAPLTVGWSIPLYASAFANTHPAQAPQQVPMTPGQLRTIRDANRYLWWVNAMFTKPSEVAVLLAPCQSPDEVDAAIDRAMNGITAQAKGEQG